MAKFGNPGSHRADVVRWLRRGTDGLAAGRSEAAAPVVLGKGQRRKGRQGVNGTSGAPGPPAVTDLERPWQGIRRLPPNNTDFGAGAALFLAGYTTRPSAPDFVSSPATLDAIGSEVGTIPYAIWQNVQPDPSGGPLIVSMMQTVDALQVGQGNGRGGFLCVWQWIFLTGISGTRYWFAGITQVEFGNQPTLADEKNLAGVGQFGDSTPRFKWNDDTGTVSSSATGFGAPVTGKLYEARVFANPRATSVQMSLESWSSGVSDGRALLTVTSNLPNWTSTAGPGFDVSLRPYLLLGAGADGGTLSLGIRGLYVALQPGPDITIDS